MPLSEAQALVRLRSQCAADVEPTLNDAEIADCLAQNTRNTVWLADTVYAVGACVVPPIGNGCTYSCIRAGTSGAVVPAALLPVGYAGVRVYDGTAGLLWQNIGAAHPERFDVTGATGAAWLLKAAKDAGQVDVSDRDTKITLSVRRDFALRQAARYRAICIA